MVVDAKKWLRVLVTISREQAEKIEEYRRSQPVIPNRAEAVRRIIDAGLKTLARRK